MILKQRISFFIVIINICFSCTNNNGSVKSKLEYELIKSNESNYFLAAVYDQRLTIPVKIDKNVVKKVGFKKKYSIEEGHKLDKSKFRDIDLVTGLIYEEEEINQDSFKNVFLKDYDIFYLGNTEVGDLVSVDYNECHTTANSVEYYRIFLFHPSVLDFDKVITYAGYRKAGGNITISFTEKTGNNEYQYIDSTIVSHQLILNEKRESIYLPSKHQPYILNKNTFEPVESTRN